MPENLESPKKDSVAAQQEPLLTEQQALRKVGWIQPIDYFILFCVLGVFVTLLYWNIFASPTVSQTIGCCLIAYALVQLWVVILVFRCAHFVLLLTAYVNTLPETAAKLVIAYYSGRQPVPQSKKP
jgi:hypothetical protein